MPTADPLDAVAERLRCRRADPRPVRECYCVASRRRSGLRVTSSLREAIVLRADGFQVESALPYAGLQRLGIPLEKHLDAIPERQRRALRIAAGVEVGTPPDRYLVGLGMLSLLAAAGQHGPVICVIDDAVRCTSPRGGSGEFDLI